MRTLFKLLVYGLSFLRKTSIEVEFTNEIQLSDVIECVGYKEIYVKSDISEEYPYVWFIVPSDIKSIKPNEGFRLMPSDRSGYHSKIVLKSSYYYYDHFDAGKNPITYIFGTKNPFHANKFLIYSVRPTVYINCNLFIWMIKFGYL